MILSHNDILEILHRHGFRGDGLIIGASIVLAESAGDTEAVGHNTPDINCPDGSLDRGMWQFNSCYHEDVSKECAFDPDCATDNAFRVSQGGTDYHQWSTYVAGAYRTYLGNMAYLAKQLGFISDPQPRGDVLVSIEVPAEWVERVSEQCGIPSPFAQQPPNQTPPAHTYTIEEGDSLSAIAQAFTGDENRWPQLYTLNSEVIGPDPNLIHAGTIVQLPPDWPSEKQ